MFKKKNLFCYVLCLTLLSTGCSVPTDGSCKNTPLPSTLTGSSSSTTISDTQLISDLSAKYPGTIPFDKKVYYLDRNEVLELDLNFPLSHEHNTGKMFRIFLDPALTVPLWNPAPENYYIGYDKIKIKPKNYPLFGTEFQEEGIRENANWGNLGTLYLAQYYDGKGNMTDDPQSITVLKIKTELDKPNVSLNLDSKGLATLSWQPIEGATKYTIYSVSLLDNNISGDEILMYYRETTNTSFSDFKTFLSDTSDISGMVTNNVLSTNVDFYDTQEGYSTAFVVMAEGPSGTSEISQIIKPSDYAHILPYSMDYRVKKEDLVTDNQLRLPIYAPVQMCDDSLVLFPIDYDLVTLQNYKGEYTPVMDEQKGKSKAMSILGRVKGTSFERVYHFVYYPASEDIQTALKDFLQRQQSIVAQASGITDLATIRRITKESQSHIASTQVSVNKDLPVTATNPFSEYLAYHMLSGNTAIPLSDFPQATDTDNLIDALQEALTQNSLIFEVTGMGIDPSTNSLLLEYKYTPEEQKARQKEVLEEANRIVAQIIKPSMSDLEKEEAINQYLCDNFTYDYATLENAAKHNYKYADPEFDDSFTVYGALIKKVCVCKGYAEAFKLLADLSGLESLVVSGKLDSIGHAWNKVKIDGEWFTLDVTNNDREFVSNALFNLPDDVATLVLAETKEYVLDANYDNYHSQSRTSEYYYIQNKFYPKAELEEALVTALSSDSKEIVLRTDYGITDEELSPIVMAALKRAGNPPLADIQSWYGVLYLKKP